MRKGRHPRHLSEWEKIGDLKETITLSVSSRGTGLCFYIPKTQCDVYGLISGDLIKVSLRDHFRKRRPEDEEESK